MSAVALEIREALECFDWYHNFRCVGHPNPTALSIFRAESILVFHARRYAELLEQGDAPFCFWLGKDSDTRGEAP